MPRTPLIFPEKVRWNLPGQEDADPSLEFHGATMSNYASAEKYRQEVKAVLEDQAVRGQIEIVAESVAKERFGSSLAVASLAAIEKGVKKDGGVEVRVVHDGTNGVGDEQQDQGARLRGPPELP